MQRSIDLMFRTPHIRALIWCVGILLIAGEVIVTAVTLRAAHRAVERDATTTVSQIVRTGEIGVNQLLLQVDALLLGLGNLRQLLPEGNAANGDAVHHLLEELRNHSFAVQDILLYDPEGRFVNAASRVTRERQPPLAPELRTALEQQPAAGLQIGQPMVNPRTGEWIVPFGRALHSAGRTEGFAVAEIFVHSFADIFALEPILEGLHVRLKRSDGMVLASIPPDPGMLGTYLGKSTDDFPTDGRAYFKDSFISGRPVITAARTIAHTPLLIRASLDIRTVFRYWMGDFWIAVSLSIVFAVVVGIAAMLLVRVIRQRESALAEKDMLQSALTAAVDSMTEGFVLFDLSNHMVVCNARYLEIYPHQKATAVPGASFRSMVECAARAVLPDATEEEREEWIAWRQELHHGGNKESEQQLADGRVIHVTIWRIEGYGIASVHRDVTAQRLQAADLHAAKTAAEAANKAKSTFLANMSHELRTPLNAIIGFSEIIRDGALGDEPERYVEYANDINRSGQHLLSLINEILDLSKVEAGQTEIEMQTLSLRELIGQCRTIAEAAEAGKKMDWGVDIQGPDEIESDPRILKQIVINLLSNAVKFTPSGGCVGLQVAVDPLSGLELTVANSGIGIPSNLVEKVFEPFQQAEAATSRRYGGTGLGLAIVKRYVDLLGGEIAIDSEVDKGTTVTVRLPVNLPVANSAAPEMRRAVGED